MRIARLNRTALPTAAFVLIAGPPLFAQDLVLHALPLSGSAGPLVDPEAAYWKDSPEIKVPMEAQIITNPQNADPAVKELTVRAAHNGQWLAFLIQWADPTKSERIVVDQSGDHVAVELPST